MGTAIDLTGLRYNHLLVIQKDLTDITRRKWICKCDCGNTKSIDRNSFIKGLTTSCGCVHISNHTKHGDTGTRLYTIWQDMKARCNDKSRRNYGAIGVSVCCAWEASYDCFKEWALANGYSDILSIDRIDSAPIYSPDTCRWATRNVQSRNRRSKEGGTSQYVGVHYLSAINKFRAVLKVDKRNKHIGVFPTEELAALARDAYILKNNLEGYVINFK